MVALSMAWKQILVQKVKVKDKRYDPVQAGPFGQEHERYLFSLFIKQSETTGFVLGDLSRMRF